MSTVRYPTPKTEYSGKNSTPIAKIKHFANQFSFPCCIKQYQHHIDLAIFKAHWREFRPDLAWCKRNHYREFCRLRCRRCSVAQRTEHDIPCTEKRPPIDQRHRHNQYRNAKHSLFCVWCIETPEVSARRQQGGFPSGGQAQRYHLRAAEAKTHYQQIIGHNHKTLSRYMLPLNLILLNYYYRICKIFW